MRCRGTNDFFHVRAFALYLLNQAILLGSVETVSHAWVWYGIIKVVPFKNGKLGVTMTILKAHATPTKNFFVRMITKDISLEDCILDLVDNCLDGARKLIHSAKGPIKASDFNFDGYEARVDFTSQNFQITDNCGGIKTAEAEAYAFHFGRRHDTPSGDEYSIGLYGIGMKRAIFKIGNMIEIESSTQNEAFRTDIDVPKWLMQEGPPQPDGTPTEDWDFELEQVDIALVPSTSIKITQLHPEISSQFSNPSFAHNLSRMISRDYSQLLAKGFKIFLNGEKVEGFPFIVRESADFKPIRLQYKDETGIEVEIIAGMAAAPPDDLSPTDRRSETEYYGWFVLCNDRVVVASDKTDKTVWGNSGFPSWHYQYNGFIGVASFHSKDPNLLPWTTTKRDIDDSNAAFRRAIERMKEVTRPWLKYTNDRKADLEEAKQKENQATAMPLFDVPIRARLEVPKITNTASRISYNTIQYQKPTKEIVKAKELLGNANMTNKALGEKVFDYFILNESEE
jgi:hypothetical protein